MVEDARSVLTGRGVREVAIHDELFFAGPPESRELPPEPDEASEYSTVTFTLEGRSSTVKVDPAGAANPRSRPQGAPRAAVLLQRRDVRLVQGPASLTARCGMDKNFALVPSDLDAGYVLTCQSHPVTDEVSLDYDV